MLFSQLPFAVDLINANRKRFRYEIVYHKSTPVGFLNANVAPLRSHENILVFYDKKPTYNPQKTKGKPYIAKNKRPTSNYHKFKNVITENKGDRYPIDIVKFNRDKKNYHPTQKPVALCEYLIKTYTNEGEVVLDNCMGSGSTIIAAIRTKRKYIGFEKDEGYFEIAKERIKAEDEAEN